MPFILQERTFEIYGEIIIIIIIIYQELEKVKVDTEKVKKLSVNIPKGNITKLDEVMHAGAKLVLDKIGVLKGTRRNTKPAWKIC